MDFKLKKPTLCMVNFVSKIDQFSESTAHSILRRKHISLDTQGSITGDVNRKY